MLTPACPVCSLPLTRSHRICKHCRKHFKAQTERWTQKYCSPACRQAAYRARQDQPHSMPCRGCGQWFNIGPGFTKTSRAWYCSNACKQRAYRRRKYLRAHY